MAFNQNKLPKLVREGFNRGTKMWIDTVKKALEVDYTNVDKLTDMVFYMHHPELLGRPLRVGESKLIAEWKFYRTLIRVLVSAATTVKEVISEDPKHSDCPHSFRGNVEYGWRIEEGET